MLTLHSMLNIWECSQCGASIKFDRFRQTLTGIAPVATLWASIAIYGFGNNMSVVLANSIGVMFASYAILPRILPVTGTSDEPVDST